VFTARYELSPYIKRTRFVFKGLILTILFANSFYCLNIDWRARKNYRTVQYGSI
jgi:hypothetical protein